MRGINLHPSVKIKAASELYFKCCLYPYFPIMRNILNPLLLYNLIQKPNYYFDMFLNSL